MRCAICGRRIDENRESNLYFFVCSRKCQDEFNRRVEEILRQRRPDLVSKAGDDEYDLAIAKIPIEEELSRPVRLENLRENLKKLGLEKWIPYAEHLMILNERQPGSNAVDVMLDGQLYTIFYSGDIEPTKGYGYYWIRVDGGWQKVRPDDSPYSGEFIPDEKMSKAHLH